MKTVFIGASKFGLRCLEQLLQIDEFKVKGVVTASEKFVISYRPEGVTNVLHVDIESICHSKDIPCVVLRDSMNDKILIESVMGWNPDLFLVVGWYHMIPKSWRVFAPAYGLHASLLPDYSGGAPLVWAMINGEKQTGITLFQLDDGVDSGPIVGQNITDIKESDTIETLYSRVEVLGLNLIRRYLPAIAKGTAKLVPQDQSKRRIFPQRRPEDGLIDWMQSSDQLTNFVRAQTRPYPGAFTTWSGKAISIWCVRPVDKQKSSVLKCGEVLQNESNAMLVNTGSGVLEILEATYEGYGLEGHQLREIISGGDILGAEKGAG